MNEQARLLLLAQDPSADHRELGSLASQEDEAIQRALVSNPSTPLELLMQLGEKFPALLLENLVFPLLLLEDPMLSVIPVKALVALAKLPQFPSGLLASLTHHPNWEVRAAVAANPSTPPEVLISLLENEDINDSNYAENNPSMPQEYLQLFQRARRLIIGVTKRINGKAIREKSEEPPLTSEEIKLLFSRGRRSRTWLARNPVLPLSMMEPLLTSPEFEIRASLGSNPSLPSSLLMKVASDPSRYVYSTVIYREDLPLTAMGVLSMSSDIFIRTRLAVNLALPVELLELLASDAEAEVRQSVLLNKELPASIAQKLLRDSDIEVRCRLASHTNDEEILRHLAGDDDAGVRQTASENPNMPREFIELMLRAGCSKDLSKRVRPDLSLSAKELEPLLQSGPFARSLVALHPNASDEARWQLAAQNDTRYWVARSLFTSKEILRHLSCLLNEELRFWVATNKGCPVDILERLAFDRCAGVRKAVAAHPDMPIATLEVLSQDVSAFVRYGLTQNSRITPELRHRLKSDASHYVSYWADPHP
jgi:hypothetical protein